MPNQDLRTLIAVILFTIGVEELYHFCKSHALFFWRKRKMAVLQVLKIVSYATLPTVAHPGEDIAYDLYACDDVVLHVECLARVRTGIAVALEGHGFLLRERSSLAARGITVSGGVVDAGYRGEIFVNLTLSGQCQPYRIKAGDRIGQIIPVRVQTLFPVIEVEGLPASCRATGGYGSTGR